MLFLEAATRHIGIMAAHVCPEAFSYGEAVCQCF